MNKWYDKFHVLRDIDLQIMQGERIVLWGPSGSGKTTLIRCLAGLESVEAGEMEIAGARKKTGPMTRPVPTEGVGMVFQASALFTHMRVIDNLTLGLTDVRKVPVEEARAIAMRHLDRVRMSDYALRYPRQLSGGQQQRAEIARALCM
ncbi:MAG TPA: ATP-binding cassette domain-containing protein, partial [Casimicrobiaceae bacterium]